MTADLPNGAPAFGGSMFAHEQPAPAKAVLAWPESLNRTRPYRRHIVLALTVLFRRICTFTKSVHDSVHTSLQKQTRKTSTFKRATTHAGRVEVTRGKSHVASMAYAAEHCSGKKLSVADARSKRQYCVPSEDRHRLVFLCFVTLTFDLLTPK